MYYFFYVKKEILSGTEEREMQRIKDVASKSLMTDQSKRIFKQLQIKKLRELFDLIDGDKDGEISENSFLQA